MSAFTYICSISWPVSAQLTKRQHVPVVATLEIRSKKSSDDSSIRSLLIGAEDDEITETAVKKERQRSLYHFVSLAIYLLSR